MKKVLGYLILFSLLITPFVIDAIHTEKTFNEALIMFLKVISSTITVTVLIIIGVNLVIQE